MAYIDDVLAAADKILGSTTGKGATIGALAGQLLSSYGQGAGGVNLGVDMSKVGNIPTRGLTAYQPKYRTYAEYGARDLPLAYVDPALAKALGVSTVIPTNLGQTSQYTAKPSTSTLSPLSLTGAGSGVGKLISPTITPTSNTTISPVVGALLGAAAGSLAQPSVGTASGGTTGGITSGALGNLGSTYRDVLNFGRSLLGLGGSSGSYTIPNYTYDTTTVQTDGSTYPSGQQTTWTEFPVYKDGGMTTPLMAADGGAVDGYYTYGDQINPADVLSGYAHGGETHPGGLQSMVEGRVDFRDGSAVNGAGDGQSDDIPAMLADGEFVIDSETVAQLGNGSTKAGANLLDEFRKAVREHKRSAPVDEIPPPSSPLQYMKTAMANAKEKNRG